MIDQESIKLQKFILVIAKEIVRICNKYNIPYFLDGGTQLGATRHQGFIPWDDDFDIAMKRKDYEYFLEVCKLELDSNKFFLQNEWTEDKYAFAFSKIQLVGTEIVEDFSKNVDIKHGIYVDIFPYDNIPDNIIERKFFKFINNLIKNLLWVKCGYGASRHKRTLNYKLMKLLSPLFSVKWMKKTRGRLITKYNNIITKECFTSDYPKNELLNKWFNDFIYYKFEDEQFRGFEESDSFLKTLYGNYMQLPKESERKKHSHYDIDFGNYE